MKQPYLSWLAAETKSSWNNDSAVQAQVDTALENGAIGITTNPPLSYEALTTDTHLYGERLAALDRALPDDEYAFQAMCLVVEHFAAAFRRRFEREGGLNGCVRAQVAPNLRADYQGMLEAGKRLAAIGGNVLVKIPATAAGIRVLEELAALGIPTNPTVVTTVAQAVASAEAYERGRERALQAGIKPAPSTCAVVMGRAQDYLAQLNRERGLGLSTEDLEWAALAIVKRSDEIYRQRGYRSRIMPAAFRAPIQVEQLAGGEYHSTIHPTVQAKVEAADQAGTIRRELFADVPADRDAVGRVAAALPEFRRAWELDGLALEDFDTFGAVVMTLDGFEKTGWQKLISLKKQEVVCPK